MQRRRRPVVVIVALVAVLVMLGGACGGDAEGAIPEGSLPSVDVVAASGGTATVLQAIDAATLDPTAMINTPAQGSAALSAIYDGLFTVDQQTGAIEPRLATDFSSQDGLTWTLTLRPGVTFSDGTPLDAAAVEAQWRRVAADVRAQASFSLRDVVSMTVVDDVTLEVVLGAVNRQLHQLVAATSLTWIPSPAVVAAGADLGSRPVGAGPFVLRTRTPGSETVLDRNPTYWQAGLPELDTLVVTTIQDPQQSYDTLTTGGAQASVNVPDRFAAEAEAAGYTTLGVDQVAGIGWIFGTDRAPFDDLRARRAVSLATDLEALDETVNGGEGTVPRSLFPEGTPFHDPDAAFPAPDPAEAQRLLDELAAEGAPVSFTIVHPGGDAAIRAIALQTQLSEFENLRVEVRQLDGATYGVTLLGGGFDLAAFAVGGADPEPAIAGLRSTHPLASLDSATVDRAVQDAREATDDAGRRAAYDRLTAEMDELHRFLWMSENHAWAVVSPDATGLATNGQGTPWFERFGLVA